MALKPIPILLSTCTCRLPSRSRAARVSALELDGRLSRKSLRFPETERRSESEYGAPGCLGDVASGMGCDLGGGKAGKGRRLLLGLLSTPAAAARASFTSADPVLFARRRGGVDCERCRCWEGSAPA